MSEFRTLCLEYRNCGLINNAQCSHYTKKYDSLNEEYQSAYDKHCDKILSSKTVDQVITRKKIEKIHSNLQFYTWIIIINTVVVAIWAMATL